MWNSLINFFGIFNHIECKVNLKLSRQLYYAFIYSKIKYVMEVYGSCSSTSIEKFKPCKLNRWNCYWDFVEWHVQTSCICIWTYWKYLTSTQVMSSALWMTTYLGDLLIYLKITLFCKIIIMTCVVKDNWMFHHAEHKYVTKKSESLGPLSGIDWKNVCYSTVLKVVLRNSCWNIICLDTMYEFCWMQIQNNV